MAWLLNENIQVTWTAIRQIGSITDTDLPCQEGGVKGGVLMAPGIFKFHLGFVNSIVYTF